MILDQQFLEKCKACSDGIEFAEKESILGLEYGNAIKTCLRMGNEEYAGWLVEQKKTEAYVRANGKVITVIKYNVFNPVTGENKQVDTLEEARVMSAQIAKEVLKVNPILVHAIIQNELGHESLVDENTLIELDIQ